MIFCQKQEANQLRETVFQANYGVKEILKDIFSTYVSLR